MIPSIIIPTLLNLQHSAITAGDPPFAAVIVVGDEVIAAVHNTSRSSGNPLEHAEISAIRAVIETHGAQILQTAHLIASNEPCLMCIGACIWSGIRQVSYFVSQEELAAVRGWGRFVPAKQIAAAEDSGIVVTGPIGNDEMLKLHRDFWTADGNAAFRHSIHLAVKKG